MRKLWKSIETGGLFKLNKNKLLDKFHRSPRRNKYEIWIEILDLCTDDNIHLSFIIRELRLQTEKCKDYLTFLVERDLIKVLKSEKNGIIYQTTPKGRECVERFLEDINTFFT